MKKLTILVDMDDTIEELLLAWVAWLNAAYGTSVRKEDISDWDVSKAFPGLTKAQVYAPLQEDDFWETVEPMEGAADHLQKLIDDGHTVLIVTTSDYKTLRAKMDGVLFRYFPMFRWEDVIITSHKALIDGDVLIDDGPHNMMGGRYEKVLMDAPHNRRFDAEANGIMRVFSWKEAYEAVCGIARD